MKFFSLAYSFSKKLRLAIQTWFSFSATVRYLRFRELTVKI